MMKIFLLCGFSLCSVLASASTLEWCLDHFPHRHFYPDDSEPHGPTVDLIQELSKRTGFTITYSTNTPFPRCLQHMKQGKSDLMTSLNYSEARAEFMYLLPYDKARVEVLYQRKGAPALNSWAELSNQQLGMVRGYVYTQVTSRCEFQSRWAGLKALYAALTVVALEPLKLPTAALPKALFSPAEFCILKLLGYAMQLCSGN